MEVVNRIAANKGIGTTLSLGPFRAAKKLGKESLSCFPSVVELIQMHTEAVAGPLAPAQRDIYFPKVNNNAHEKSYPIKTTGMRVTDRWKNGSIDRRAIGKMPGWEVSEMVANCLGFNGFHIPEDILDMPLFSVYEKLLDLVTGLRVKKNDLAEIAHRCYATERLLNLRESPIHGQPASITEAFDVPVGLRMTKPCWDELELKTFQRLVSRYYRGKGWDRKSMVKLRFFKNLGIDDLWVLVK
jgi:aldehyde:ferredoxin oxidoreductase